SEAAARLRRSVLSFWMFDLFAVILVTINGFDHGVMEARPQFFDRLVLAVGPGAIGQQRNRELALRVDPQRSTGIAQMAVRAGIKVLTRLRRLGRRVPPNCPR